MLDVGQVRLRWVGHQLWAECEIAVSGDITAVEAHGIAVDAEHELLHALPRLSVALVHTDPQPRQGTDPHAVLAPHRWEPPSPIPGRTRSLGAAPLRFEVVALPVIHPLEPTGRQCWWILA